MVIYGVQLNTVYTTLKMGSTKQTDSQQTNFLVANKSNGHCVNSSQMMALAV